MTVKGERPHALTNAPFHYCPGCTHGIVHRLVAEVIDELGIEGKTVGVASVGCSVFTYNYFNCDMVQAPHGRAPAVATGVKRARPDNVVNRTAQATTMMSVTISGRSPPSSALFLIMVSVTPVLFMS